MLEGSDAKTETVQGLLLPSPSTVRPWSPGGGNLPRQPSRRPRCTTASNKNETSRAAERRTRRGSAVYSDSPPQRAAGDNERS